MPRCSGEVSRPEVNREGGLFQKLLLTLDCVGTARLLPKRDRLVVLKMILKPHLRQCARVASTVQLAGGLVSGFPGWISKFLFNAQPLRSRLELLAYGTGSTVFRTVCGSRVKVVKILRGSFGCSLEKQLQIAQEFKRKHSILASHLNTNHPIVPPTDFVILQSPLLGSPATAMVQPCLDEPTRDLLMDFTESELSLLVARQPCLRAQIRDFAEAIIKDFEGGHCCLDIVGRGNVLVLTRPDGQQSLKVVDLGMFDLTRIPVEAPQRFAQLVERIEKLKNWLALCVRAGQRIVPMDTPRTRMLEESAQRPATAGFETSRVRSGNEFPPIAYIMSRFPKLTETFVLYEIVALQEQGSSRVEVFPLLREQQAVVHPEAEPIVQRAHYQPFFSWRIILANLSFLVRQPRIYLKLWLELVAGTWSSWNFFFGTLGIFPKTALFALEMKKLGIVHVHAHFASHPAMAALIINRLTNIPYSFTAHGSDLHVERRMLDKKVENASFGIVVSEYNRRLIAKECGEEVKNKIFVIHCGVDTHLFRPLAKRESSKVFQILCVASFEEVKGHRHLIAACQILSSEGIDFQCHLVGDGPLRAEITGQIQCADLSRRFVIHGAQPRLSVVKRLQQADVFVLPSIPTPQGKREGIPMVLMEAMASGLPVVSSRISGIPELIDNGLDGFLIESGDIEALAAYLCLLRQERKLREKLGEAARIKVCSHFDLRKSAERLSSLFRSRERPVWRRRSAAPL